MKAIAVFLAVLAVHELSCADDGLFVVHSPEKITRRIEEGYLIARVPVKRVEITHVVFRPDTENPKKFWLECHMRRFLDPQGEVYFSLNGKELNAFTVRTSELVDKGSKWALLFTDRQEGMTILKAIAAIYELSKDRVIDKTNR